MNYPNLDDLNVFIHVARRSSFVGAANELGMSAAYVSKRVKLLEQNLGVVLLHRSTRQVSITEDGERIYEWAKGILESVQQMGDVVSSQGFGRRFVAPALSELAARYPKLDIRLDIQDRLVDLIEEGVDLDIRVGNQIAPHLRARHLARNWRVLCASPAYRQGTPVNPGELANHDCLVIKERDRPFGIWHLHGPQGREGDRQSVDQPWRNCPPVVPGRARAVIAFALGCAHRPGRRSADSGSAEVLAGCGYLGGAHLTADELGEDARHSGIPARLLRRASRARLTQNQCAPAALFRSLSVHSV